MSVTAEKIEETSSELMIIDSSPAQIQVNYEQIKKHLEGELKKYDLVVTADGLAEAKKLATELNKNAAEFNRLRKEAIEKASGPIRIFDEQMKSLSQMCKDGRQKLIDQANVFEKKTLDDAREKMKALLDEQWKSTAIDPEFQRASIDDLVKLTAVTGKGNLTAKVKDDIKSRVMRDKSLQDQTNMRLVVLENQSYKAGLTAPLSRPHVESFLFEDDDSYQKKLDAMLESEKQRQALTETALRDRISSESVKAETSVEPEPEKTSEPVDEQSNIVTLPKRQLAEKPAANAIVQPEIEYAYGPLEQISKASFLTTTRLQVEAKALADYPDGNVGIWTKDGLVTQILRDESVTQ